MSIFFIYIFKSGIVYNHYEKVFIQKYPNALKKDETVQYNKCVKNRIPKISGLLETAQYLRYSNNSLVSFGDGEIDLIEMIDRPYQKAEKELSTRLRQAFESDLPSLSIAILYIMSNCYGMTKDQYYYYNLHKEYENWILRNANYSRQYFDAHITSPFIVTEEFPRE